MKSISPGVYRIGIWAGLLCLAGGVVAEEPARDTIDLRGEFFCSVERQLAPPFGGTVTDLAVKVGQAVQEGEVLIRYELDAPGQADWNEAMSPAALSGAEAELTAAAAEADLAQAAVRDAEEMAGQQLISAQQLEKTRRQAAVARARLKAARGQADLARLQLESRQARLAELAAPDDAADRDGRSRALRSPLDGVVVYLSGGLQPGAALAAGTPVAAIGVMDPMILRAHVHELEAVKLQVGATAAIQPLALPGVSLQGTVSRIAWAPVPHHLSEPSYYEMEMIVPNADHAIRQGYKADIRFQRDR